MLNGRNLIEHVLSDNIIPNVNIDSPLPLFDTKKNKYVKKNRKNTNRLV